jgi:iron uptake system EfeUOB component EfeO/EfeM
MTDQFMGRADKKGGEREAKLVQSVADGRGSIKGARKSLDSVKKDFKSQAKDLVDAAEAAFDQINTLVADGEYSDAGDVVAAFERAHAADLAALQARVEKGDFSLTMVAVLVENLRTVGRRTVGL